MSELKIVILVTKVSDRAKKGFQMCHKLFRDANAEFTLLHVIPQVGESTKPSQELMSEIENNYKDIEKICEEHDLEYKSIVLHGNICDEIVTYTKNENIDLLIMGQNHSSWIDDFLNENITKTVTKLIECPVLLY